MRPPEEKKEMQKTRVEIALFELAFLGIDIESQSETEITFNFKGHLVKYFPFTGWHTGKSIIDGRGLNNLLKQLQ